MPVPRIYFSRCLGFAACRWNGERLRDEFVERLASRVEVLHDCPEMGIGLGCPRDPIRAVKEGGTVDLYQPATGRSVGAEMRAWSSSLLDSLPAVDGFLLKSRSPSCGWKDAKVYNSRKPDAGSAPGAGLFGAAVLAARPGVPVEGINWGVVGRERHPVDVVTWYQARGFCFWAGRRLCSESEWEKAARGTDGRLYPWGNEAPTCERAVMKTGGYDACGNANSFAVGSKPLGRSPYGVEDMLGNVSEMTQDWLWLYAEAPTDGSAREWGDEPPAAELQNRALRGSSLADDAMYTRATLRNAIYQYQRGTAIGFRCCTSVAPR